ncbi:unnamed protein product [Hapterophycus canaliculatus]
MPIRELSEELVLDIAESYGQITKLNLSTNEISRVENLQHLTCLTNLDLCCNRLGSVPGSLDGLAPLTRLKNLDISENSITSLEPLSSAPVSLARLDVANNCVAGTFQISFLASLTALTELVLRGNPLAEEEGYADRSFTTLPLLDSLDNVPRNHHHYRRHQEDRVKSSNWARSAHISPTDASTTAREIGPEPCLVSPFENLPPQPATSGPNPSPGSSASPPPSHPGGTSIGSSVSDEGQARGMVHQDAHVDRGRLVDQSGNPSGNPSAEPESAAPVPIFFSPVVSDSVQFAGGWDRKVGLGEREASSWGGIRGGSSSFEGPGVFSKGEDGAAAGGSAAQQREARLMAGGSPPVEQTSVADGLRTRTPAEPATVAAASTCLSTPAEMGSLAKNAENRAAVNGGSVSEAGSIVPRAEGSGRHIQSDALLEVPSSVKPTVTSRVTAGSGAAARTSSPLASHDDRGVEDEGVKGGVLPSWAAIVNERALGSRSSRESTLEQQYSEAPILSFSGSGADEGATATLRFVLQTGSGRAEGAGFDDNGRQVVLANGAAAAATMAPRRVVEIGRTTANVAPDRSDDIFGCQGPTATATIKPSGRHSSVDDLAAPVSATGAAGTGTAGVVGGRDSSRWSGWGRVDTFDSHLRHAAGPLKSGRSTGSLGDRASGIPPGGVEKATSGGESQTVVVSKGEWEALKRENDDLKRQATLTEKRCAALTEMQRLTDKALSSAHPPPLSFSSGARAAAAERKHARHQEDSGDVLSLSLSSSSSSSLPEGERPENHSQERSAVDEPAAGDVDEGEQEADGEGGRADVARLLAAWRAEVLKLLLQRGVAAEVAAEESRQARRTVSEEREARGRAEAETESLLQRALAAEAEAELLDIKLARAFEELREDRAGRSTAEASSMGHSMAVRDLREWVQGFVARASEGFFEREALLARAVAKLEAFSERLSLAAGRVQVLETLLRRKEVQLRNSRAALVADRRVWLLERRDREIAALSSNATVHRLSPASSTSSRTRQPYPGADATGRRGKIPLDSSRREPSSGTRATGDGIVDGVHGGVGGVSKGATGGAVAIQSPLLEGLRPECEAVMRALFCRVDRLGTGAVRARRLLSVLRSDCGVSEVMEAAVGRSRWRAALDSMEAALCPPSLHADPAGPARTESSGRGDVGEGGDRSGARVGEAEAAAVSGSPRSSEERDVTWGEFLLFFLPSAGNADDAYNAGLVFHAGGREFPGAGGARQRSGSFGAVSEDAAAMLQMVVPDRWTAGGDGVGAPRAESTGGAVAGTPATGRRGDVILGRGLAALSVGRLRREVLRLARERGFLLALVREDCRIGRRRAEAVHDQYRHELRALHSKMGELERSLAQVSCRADTEQEKATAVQEELSRSMEEAKRVEQEWKRRVDAAVEEKVAALEESSLEAAKSANAARERISRLEAQHSLALRENGKASVRQRALERELARTKSSMRAEADVEKEALEERVRVGESKLATARRERNALLAALRDLQKRGRSGSDPLSLFAPSSDLGASRGGGLGMAVQELDGDSGGDGGSVAGVGAVDGIFPPAVGDKRRGVRPCVSTVATPVVVSAKGGRAKSTQEQVVPEAVQPRVSGGLLESGGGASDDAVDLRFGGERSGRECQGSGSGGPVHRDAERTASLSARLEVLALQTQQLLADGSDTSYGADDSDFE